MQFKSNDMYYRLIHSFVIAAYRNCEYLDLVNFNRIVYREVIDSSLVNKIFNPSYGYGAPDASFELGRIIKYYEWHRAQRFKKWLLRKQKGLADKFLKENFEYEKLSVGSGVGSTGVMVALLKSIYDIESDRISQNPEVILCVPNYSVYDGIVRAHGGKSVYLLTNEKNNFLPTLEQVKKLTKKKTIAVVLTYPNNPAQTTYTLSELDILFNIINYCQENKIYLIVDNVYEDTIWDDDEVNPEIFSFIDNPDYIFKVFSPSKDRPFFSGLRMGYYIGDPKIAKAYHYYASLFTNTHNNHSSIIFAIDILFRKKMIEGTAPSLDDYRLLDTFLTGWNIHIDPVQIYEEFRKRNIFEEYYKNVFYNNKLMKNSLNKIKNYINELDVVERTINGNIGNLIFAKVNPDVFDGSCNDFFEECLDGAKLGILPANVFGTPIEKGNAWFRITTMHEPTEVILDRLDRMNNYFMK